MGAKAVLRMSEHENRRQANQVSSDRLVQMTEASLRISSGLDVREALRSIADSARTIALAQYSAIEVLEPGNAPGELVISGFTPEEGGAAADSEYARSMLERLRETGEVWVVQDSANGETKRIVGDMNPPGSALLQLLEVMTCRKADGRVIPLPELITTRAFIEGDTVIADEVVIHVPDGRAVPTLVNARPVYGEDGQVVSVVASIQEISSLKEQKGHRSGFLDFVGHQLRTCLKAIKESAASALGYPYPMDSAETLHFVRIIDEQADNMRHHINHLADMEEIESGTLW